MTMRILMLSGDFYPVNSGGARDDWVFARKAVAKGHDVVVYTDRPPGTESRERVDGVEIRRPFRVQPTDRHPNSLLGQFRRILMTGLLFFSLLGRPMRHEISVIYATNHALHPIAKVLGLLYGLPVVNYIAYSPSINEDDPSKPRSVFLFESLIFRLFLGDLVLSRTPQVAEKVRRLSSADTRLAHGILDASETRSLDLSEGLPEPEHSGTQLVYVARLVPIKNPVGALQVLEQLPESYRLWLIGDGQERDVVEEAIRARGLESRVEMLGELPHHETLRHISAADALILSSHTEAYPTVVFESLSLGTHVHATPVGILPEIEHERLTLSTLDEMPSRIRSTRHPADSAGIDEETLERYSMERFASTTLQALQDVQA